MGLSYLKLGDSRQFTSSSSNVTWSSTAPSIVSVSSSGLASVIGDVASNTRVHVQAADSTTGVPIDSEDVIVVPSTSDYSALVNAAGDALVSDIIVVRGSTSRVPANTVLPALAGTAQSGQTLSCSTGTWANSPTSYAYQWQTSTTGTGGWSNVSGATSSTYVAQSGDVGNYLRCVVTATNSVGSDSAASAATTKIATSTVSYSNIYTFGGGTNYGKVSGIGVQQSTGYVFLAERNVNSIVRVDTDGANAIQIAASLSYAVLNTVMDGSQDYIFATAEEATTGHGFLYRFDTRLTSQTPFLVASDTSSSGGANTYGGVCLDDTNHILYTPNHNANAITKIAGTDATFGTVTVTNIAVTGYTLYSPEGIALSKDGTTVYVSNYTASGANDIVAVVLATGAATVIYTHATPADFGMIVTNSAGDIFVPDYSNSYIYKLHYNGSAWVQSIFAGTGTATDTDGSLATATVNLPFWVEICSDDTLMVTEYTSGLIRIIPAVPGVAAGNIVAPAISGTATHGNALTVSDGLWSHLPYQFAYQWQTSANGTSGWSNLSATTKSYAIQAADIGNYLRCTVTATNGNGSVPASSAASAQVN